MKKKHSTANILLIELVLVILFFMLCVSTIVEMFGQARVKSAYAKASSEAMLIVENLEEQLTLSDDAGAALEKAGFRGTENGWELAEENYVITATETMDATAAGKMRTVIFSAEQPKLEKHLFELPVVNYLPGEVIP